MKNDFDTGIRIKISSFVTPLFLTRGIIGVYKGWINIHTNTTTAIVTFSYFVNHSFIKLEIIEWSLVMCCQNIINIRL